MAQVQPAATEYEANIQRTLSAIYDNHDQEAEQALAAMDAARPGFPGGPVYRALLASWRAFEDPGNTERVARFRTVSDEAIRVSTAWTKAHPQDAEGFRYLASALGQRSQFAISVVPNNRELVTYGLKARDAVFKAFNMDKTDKDVLIGVGAANYFAANIPWFIRPIAYTLGVRGGDRELGLQQIRESMNEGPHSKVEAAMVLSAAMYSEENYAEFNKIMTERVINAHPSLLPAAAWLVSGCICGGMSEDARKIVKKEVADDGWRNLQLGRIALANRIYSEAEASFTKAIEAGGNNKANLAWAYYGRSLARTNNSHPDGGDMRRAKETSPVAYQLAERMFRRGADCKR